MNSKGVTADPRGSQIRTAPHYSIKTLYCGQDLVVTSRNKIFNNFIDFVFNSQQNIWDFSFTLGKNSLSRLSVFILNKFYCWFSSSAYDRACWFKKMFFIFSYIQCHHLIWVYYNVCWHVERTQVQYQKMIFHFKESFHMSTVIKLLLIITTCQGLKNTQNSKIRSCFH